MNAISTAVAGLGSSHRPAQRRRHQAANPTSDMDLVQSVVGQIDAQVAFAMDTQVIATADKMIGQLLDITA